MSGPLYTEIHSRLEASVTSNVMFSSFGSLENGICAISTSNLSNSPNLSSAVGVAYVMLACHGGASRNQHHKKHKQTQISVCTFRPEASAQWQWAQLDLKKLQLLIHIKPDDNRL